MIMSTEEIFAELNHAISTLVAAAEALMIEYRRTEVDSYYYQAKRNLYAAAQLGRILIIAHGTPALPWPWIDLGADEFLSTSPIPVLNTEFVVAEGLEDGYVRLAEEMKSEYNLKYDEREHDERSG